MKCLPVSTADSGEVVSCYEAFIALPPAQGGQLALGGQAGHPKGGGKAEPWGWHLPSPRRRMSLTGASHSCLSSLVRCASIRRGCPHAGLLAGLFLLGTTTQPPSPALRPQQYL